MENRIGLEKLHSRLFHPHLKLNLNFLNELLINASKGEKPHRNQEFAKKIKCPVNKTKKSATTIYGWMKGYRTVPLSKLSKIIILSSKYSWKDIENNLISIKAGIRGGEISPKFPIRVGKKLGSVIGHLLGDGSIDRRFGSLFYSNSDVTLLKEFSDNMNFVFGIKPRIWVQKRRSFEEKSEWLMWVESLNKVPKNHCVGLFYPKICSDILYAIYGKFAHGKNKKITREIMNANEEFKMGLVRAFFDDEGSVSFKNYALRLHQDRLDILEDLKNI